MNVTIVMYHYVRELQSSRYPKIKGLPLDSFRRQIEKLENSYRFITMEELIAHIHEGKKIPERAVLLTFDDGYLDHYTNVFPILHRKGIQGSFFPPIQALRENRVLEVNKIHFILASTIHLCELLGEIRHWLEKNKDLYQERSYESLYAEYARPSRLDPEEVIFVKRLLQKGLPEAVRRALTDDLFVRVVGVDEAAFSRELYMSVEQVQMLIRSGMHVGSHGYRHEWLETLSREEQESEISRSKKYLLEWGVDNNNLSMCYPYGSFGEATLEILQATGTKVGFTTRVGVANPTRENCLVLPRMDTVDLPC